MPEKMEITISVETILKVIGVIAGLWIAWTIRDILVLFLFVLILVSAMSPVVDRWSQSMSRPVAIGLLYALIIGLILAALSLIIPPLVLQIRQLAINLPDYIRVLLPSGSLKDVITISQTSLANLSDQLANLGASLYSTTGTVLGTLFTGFTILVLSFYMLFEEKGAKNFLLSLIPNDSHRQRIVNTIEKIGNKMGAWVRGQLLLMLVVGVLDLIGLAVLGIPYALTLGIWAGLTEVIPYVGPILGAIPAVALAFGLSPLKGILVLVLFILVQQLEAQILVPKIMQRAVGLSPVIIILAIMVGAKLLGLVGVILAVPLAAGISVLLQEEWPKLQRTS